MTIFWCVGHFCPDLTLEKVQVSFYSLLLGLTSIIWSCAGPYSCKTSLSETSFSEVRFCETDLFETNSWLVEYTPKGQVMALAVVQSRARVGIDAPEVIIEVHLSGGMPAFTIVGLAETSVKESRDRVRSAMLNSGFEFPSKRLTVNLAPADLPKEGGRFDLAIAIGILVASEQLPDKLLENHEFYGELALSGELRPVVGALPAAMACQRAGRRAVMPADNGEELALLGEEPSSLACHLLDVTAFLSGQRQLSLSQMATTNPADMGDLDLQDVVGQPHAKRALEIAAAGGHNLLFVGPPGTGKTMLASRLPGILPPLPNEQALEVAAIHSTAGQQIDLAHWRRPPFRAPHHSSSAAALVGGGSNPRPGDISLAHHGILFLDELAEYERRVLDSLREPLESGEISISRAAGKITFPARFQLIAALNPSPCGEVGARSRSTPDQILRYLGKLSGPFLDRFDLTMDVPRQPVNSLLHTVPVSDSSAEIRERVLAARERMIQRDGKISSQLTSREVASSCWLEKADQQFLAQAIEKLQLSMRAYHRILRVSRTLADLQGKTQIQRSHLAEALGYRAMDRLLQQLREP